MLSIKKIQTSLLERVAGKGQARGTSVCIWLYYSAMKMANNQIFTNEQFKITLVNIDSCNFDDDDDTDIATD